MRSSTLIMIAVAAVFGLLAVFVAQSWLNSQNEARLKNMDIQKPKQVAAQTIVVATKPLRFGSELSQATLREIAWPEDALPPGSFKTIAALLQAGKRVVLAPIEVNEPIFAAKITGAGQRATLSAVIAEGMKAVTIRVNDVEGVAGFVLPGDRVDVALTRQTDKSAATSDVVLQNARVLAIDQIADERSDKPAVAKAVTLEVDITGAQKLTLSSQVGTLSLVLRKAGETIALDTRRVSLADLTHSESGPAASRSYSSVTVTRASTKTVYSVPRDDADRQTTAQLDKIAAKP